MLIAIDPNSGQEVRRLAEADAAGIEEILARAAEAAASWRDTSFDKRAAVLRAVAAGMRGNLDALGMVMTEEMGKPIVEARAEVTKSAWCAEHFAEHAEDYLRDVDIASDATRSYVRFQPLGVLLGVLPWNAPFWLAFRFCAPALMAGNACVVKHDPHVPGCGQAIARVFEDAGAPAGLVQNLPIGNAAIAGVIRDRRVRAVSFTGSERAGAAVASVAGAVIKPTVLELGGSDPNIVLADADLDRAADTLVLSRIINAGQSCIAAKRIIVEDSVHDVMVERLRSRLAALVVGNPRDEKTQIGPLARADLRDNLHRQVRETVEAGARCVLGGELPDGPGFFYPATLLVEATNDMVACREETFGPVAVVLRAADADEAVAIANDSEYGLGAAVWTTAERGEAIAQRLVAGQVAVNGIVKTDPRLPSGGVKRSGYGRELGPDGIREFVNRQQIWIGPVRT